MRSLFAACVMLLFVVGLVATEVRAGDRQPTSQVSIDALLAIAKKDPAHADVVAALSFVKDVQGEKTVEVFSATEPELYLVLQRARSIVRKQRCAKLEPAVLAKAAQLQKGAKGALPLPLKAYVAAQQGKDAEAATLFTQYVQGLAPGTECPSEHPDSGQERLDEVDFAAQCLETLAPKQSRAAIEKVRTRLLGCALTNHAVG